MAKALYEKWLDKDNLIRLQGWARDGLTLDQIAHNMGIAKSTLHRWIAEIGEIKDALKKSREVAVYEVENAMFKAALGYDVTETEQVETVDWQGNKTVRKHARKRHIPPNTTAQIFILKNWRPEVWRERQEIISKIETTDDGFLEALKGSAQEDWKDEE
jgi:hypothetical protein